MREAHSFDQGDGRRIWGAQVAPARVDASRVAAHLALADLFGLPEPADGRIGGFDVATLDAGRASHPSALDPGWIPPNARRGSRPRGAGLAPGAPHPPADGPCPRAGGRGPPAGRTRGGRGRPGRRLVGRRRRPGESLQQDIEAGRSDDELVTRLADSFVTSGGGLAFDVSSLLPEAAEALLDRAAAGLADHLAAAAEPFLTAAQWAALANRELAAGGAGGGPEWPFALRGSAETALAHRLETLLAAGDLDAAVTLARRARSLGLAVLASPAGATAREAVSATVLDAVRRAVSRRDRWRRASKAALDTLALARELGIDPDLDRAQELVYDTRSRHRPPRPGPPGRRPRPVPGPVRRHGRGRDPHLRLTAVPFGASPPTVTVEPERPRKLGRGPV